MGTIEIKAHISTIDIQKDKIILNIEQLPTETKSLLKVRKWTENCVDNFKDGDFVTLNGSWTAIYKKEGIYKNTIIDYCGCYISGVPSSIGIVYAGSTRACKKSIQQSTEKEKQILLDAMHKSGKDWDAVNKMVVDYKWKPKPGDVCVNSNGSIFILKKMYENSAEPYIRFYENRTFTDGAFYTFNVRLANKEERTVFFERLVKEGYKWNAKKLEITKKWVPKDGDFVTLDEVWVSIYKGEGIIAEGISDYCGGCITDKYNKYAKESNLRSLKNTIRKSTDAEINNFIEQMHTVGKDWDAVNKKVVDYRWKPKYGETYFIADPTGRNFCAECEWENDKLDSIYFDRDLIRKTREECIQRAKEMLNNNNRK